MNRSMVISEQMHKRLSQMKIDKKLSTFDECIRWFFNETRLKR